MNSITYYSDSMKIYYNHKEMELKTKRKKLSNVKKTTDLRIKKSF